MTSPSALLLTVSFLTVATRSQTAWAPVPSLQRRSDCALASDTARQRVVMFGGEVTYGAPLDETWEWDGVSWVQRAPTVRPRGRSDHAMAYDPVRQRVVLFGGDVTGSPFTPTDETWEWDGTQWLEQRPALRPPARFLHRLAYDRVSQRVLLFGGFAVTGGLRALGDTWAWDGQSWTLVALGPAARALHAMATDPVTGRVLLFGGHDGNVTYPETWRWSGSDWLRLTPAHVPPARSWHALAPDTTRNRVLLVGGVAGDGLTRRLDTWEWDGTDWTLEPSLALSPGRVAHALAWDPAAGAVLLFGGFDREGMSDTRYALGGVWRVACPNLGPSARALARCAFDEARGRMVLLGGYSPGGLFTDTWEFTGREWAQAHPRRTPPPLTGWMLFDGRRQRCQLFAPDASHVLIWEWDGVEWTELPALEPLPTRFNGAVAFDTTRQRTVMLSFGSETSEWDGERWRLLTPAHRPPGRSGHVMTYDRARRYVVLFGGMARIGGFDDTWEWDGDDWKERFPAHRPRGRYSHSLVYDQARERVVMFGGAEWTDDVWEWDGVDWQRRSPAAGPLGRSDHAAVYDSWRQRMVVFSGTSRTDDTWEYGPVHPAEFAVRGGGCPGTRGTPALTSVGQRLPWGDAPFPVEVGNLLPGAATAVWLGFSDTSFGGLRLPLGLAPLGMPGCELRVAPEIGLATTATQGVARVAWPAVPDPSALGTRFFLQAMSVDPAANAAAVVWSGAAVGRIGGR